MVTNSSSSGEARMNDLEIQRIRDRPRTPRWDSSAGLIGIIAGDSIPRIGNTLAPTRWQRIDCLIPFNEGCASGD
jgi:hypothetical protein